MNRTGRRRALLYTQGLVGVGHTFRVRELARTLSADFDVHVVDGGRRVPAAPLPGTVSFTSLSPLYRDAQSLRVTAASGRPIASVLRGRAESLDATVRRFAPDLIVVEYFPFQRWELGDEILDAIACARRQNPRLRVYCSVRDVPRRPEKPRECERIAATLNRFFDCVLVHGDERITRLEEHFYPTAPIEVPIVHTGYVVRRVTEPSPPAGAPAGYVVVSAGGGVDALQLMSTSAAAWSRLVARGLTGDRQMLFFLGPFTPERDGAGLLELCAGGPFAVRPFSGDFLHWLHGAQLSISRAGYNTCAELLCTRVPALLVPGTHASDQVFRARRFADRGLADTTVAGDGDPGRFAAAILDCLGRQQVRRNVAVDGADFTREYLARAAPGQPSSLRTAK